MKILVVGGGGREHALVWGLKRSENVEQVFCAPGNGGMSGSAECIDIKADDVEAICKWATENTIDLTVIGPEQPLAMGLGDRLRRAGLVVFGPNQAAAEIESSKAFAKELMRKYDIPTADFEVFDDAAAAREYIEELGRPCVVKADGLAAGKGAIVCENRQEALQAVSDLMGDKIFGAAGERIVIEEMMEGSEFSVFAITDGRDFILLPPAQDHKRIGEGDTGKNTGGMGAYAPAPFVTPDIMRHVHELIIRPTLEGLAEEKRLYQGVLYAGLMQTSEGPKVIEFNCRFGDPECQVVLPLILSDLAALLQSCARGDLTGYDLQLSHHFAVCVVMASGGYPDAYEKGKEITGLDKIVDDRIQVFHAGTRRDGESLVTSGGRVLGVTAFGEGLESTIEMAYQAVGCIEFEKSYYRSDIAAKALVSKES